MTAAGTLAQCWGWSVRRRLRRASSAQDAAKTASTDPVMTCSSAPAKGPTTARSAARAPPTKS